MSFGEFILAASLRLSAVTTVVTLGVILWCDKQLRQDLFLSLMFVGSIMSVFSFALEHSSGMIVGLTLGFSGVILGVIFHK